MSKITHSIIEEIKPSINPEFIELLGEHWDAFWANVIKADVINLSTPESREHFCRVTHIRPFSEFIGSFFSWEESPEGDDFWSDLALEVGGDLTEANNIAKDPSIPFKDKKVALKAIVKERTFPPFIDLLGKDFDKWFENTFNNIMTDSRLKSDDMRVRMIRFLALKYSWDDIGVKDFVGSAFPFNTSPEGEEFWSELAARLFIQELQIRAAIAGEGSGEASDDLTGSILQLLLGAMGQPKGDC